MTLFQVKGKQSLLLLLFLIVLVEGIGMFSGLLSNSASTQYADLVKPSFSPPGWVFPVVWTILYFLIAVALYRILLWGSMGKDVRKAVILFGIQLFLNFLWTPIFFKLNFYGAAFLLLLLLLFFIILTTIEFCKIDKMAALLMVPYMLWVIFAGILNYSIWMLNQ